FAAQQLEVSIREGDTDPPAGWVSSDYGRRTPAPVVVHCARAPLPLRAVTLLHPVRGAGADPPRVRSVIGDDGQIAVLRFEDRAEEVRLAGRGSRSIELRRSPRHA